MVTDYEIKEVKDGANVILGGRRYPFCTIEGAFQAVFKHTNESFLRVFRAYEEGKDK